MHDIRDLANGENTVRFLVIKSAFP